MTLFSCSTGGPEIQVDQAIEKVNQMKEYVKGDEFRLPQRYVLNIDYGPLVSSSLSEKTSVALNLSMKETFATFFVTSPDYGCKLYVYAEESNLIVYRADSYPEAKNSEYRTLAYEDKTKASDAFLGVLREEASKIDILVPVLEDIGDFATFGLIWQDLLYDPFGFPTPEHLSARYYSWGKGSLAMRLMEEGEKEEVYNRLDITNYLLSSFELHNEENLTKVNVSYGSCDTSKPNLQ